MPRREHPPTLGFVGAGRAGSALATALSTAGYQIRAISSRTSARADALARAVGATTEPSPEDVAARCELVFLTVPDAEIEPVAARLAESYIGPDYTVVHTSGGVPLAILNELEELGVYVGVFHPLQALAGPSSALLLRGSAIGVEIGTDSEALHPRLERIVRALGATPLPLAGVAREPYHIAAVLASGYPLALLRGAGIEERAALAALLPLARGALRNLEELGADAALAGPIARGEGGTIARRLAYLRTADPELAGVYRSVGALAADVVRGPDGDTGVREALAS